MKILLLVFHALLSQETATFAGGCFWCMQPPFDQTKGVVKTRVGFSGGKEVSPSYKQVASGKTGHVEVVQVHYDKRTNYKKLLDIYGRNINPTDRDGQFVDRGSQYRPVIFYHDDKQKKLALDWKRNLEKSKIFPEPIEVDILSLNSFYPAPEYHQNYYKKNPIRYKYYRYASGRDKFLKKYWKK